MSGQLVMYGDFFFFSFSNNQTTLFKEQFGREDHVFKWLLSLCSASYAHTKKYLLSILFSLAFASVALKVSIKSVEFCLLVGCLFGPKALW